MHKSWFGVRLSQFLRTLGLALASVGLLTGCAKSAVPVPPSLELARPVGDLTAERKGNRVLLNFTVVAATTDGRDSRRGGPSVFAGA